MCNDITFCNNRKCEQTDCERFYKNAPFDVLLSWSTFNDKSDEEGKACKYYMK